MFDFFIAQSSQRFEPPQNGAIQFEGKITNGLEFSASDAKPLACLVFQHSIGDFLHLWLPGNQTIPKCVCSRCFCCDGNALAFSTSNVIREISDRNEAIERYKTHFEQNILGDPNHRKGLLGLRGMRLACHCKPLACHGDVIAAYLNSLDPESS